jgi:hypothetical protein
MVAGPAAKGPTDPVTVEEEEDLYRLFGKEGPLADAAAAVLHGASVGTQLSDDARYGRVRVLRTETGSPSSVDLFDEDGQKVMRLETASSGRDTDDFWAERSGNEFMIHDPSAPEDQRIRSFFVDPGAETDAAISTPSELASAIRDAFGGRLEVENERYEAHFEISTDKLSGSDPAVEIDSGEKRTSIDFSGATKSDLSGLQPGANTVIGGNENYFNAPSEAASAQDRILSPEAAEARFYAITGGAPTIIPSGEDAVSINRLADSDQIGVAANTILNARDSGEDGSALTIKDAGSDPGGTEVSEGWFKVRRHDAGRLDMTNTTDSSMSTMAVRLASQTNLDLTNDARSQVDSTDLNDGDKVLVKAQDDGSENGVYEASSTGAGVYELLKLQPVSELATESIEVSEGTDAGNLFTYDAESASFVTPQNVVLEIGAPAGVAVSDYAGAGATATALVDAYVSTLSGGYAATDVADERLGEHFDYAEPIKLEAAPAVDAEAIEDLGLSFDDDSGIQADATWSDGTLTVEISKADLQDYFGTQYDDGYVYASFDSCVTTLAEKSTEPQLNMGADRLEYAVEDFQLQFNQPLEHDLVIRPLMVTQYRLGNAITVDRTASGSNEFVITGEGTQPGEGGGAIGGMESIIGFDYGFEPAFPTIPTRANFEGGSSGLNEDAATKAQALREALEDYADEDYSMIYPAGLFVDDTKSSRDPVTGAHSEKPVDTLSILQDHQERLDARGASGLVFMNVEPMTPSTSTGRYSISKKRERLQELVGTGGSGEVAAGSMIQAESRPEFFFFDAPCALNLGNRTVEMGGAPFFAGLRSTLPNDRALYEIDLPKNQVQPVYKYDGADRNMTRQLADARINAWNIGRNVVRLASDVTGAGLVQSPSGELVESSYKTGVSVVISKEFQREAEQELENQIGPMDGSGTDHLRNVIVTQLDGVQQRVRGARNVRIDPQKDIKIDSEGGASVGVRIRCDLQVPGEVLSIDLDVGSYSEIGQQARSQDQGAAIPQSR